MKASPLNPQDFQVFFKAHAEAVRNFIYYKCGNLPQAEDIMQEAFLRLWRDRDKVDPAKAKSYVFTVSNNLFLDAVRHSKVKQKFEARPARQVYSSSVAE